MKGDVGLPGPSGPVGPPGPQGVGKDGFPGKTTLIFCHHIGSLMKFFLIFLDLFSAVQK